MKPTVFLAMPHYSARAHLTAAEAFFVTASAGACDIVARRTFGSSLLAKAFNMLWAEALTANRNGAARYFVMLHSDIGPERGFVDILMQQIQEHEADIVSAVVPIKSTEGLTSVAFDKMSPTCFEPSHRLTIREVASLPTTFDAEDAGCPGQCMLVNTGCMIIDMDKPWCHRKRHGRLEALFSIEDCISDVDGTYQVGVAPEDWQFSRLIHRFGGKVMATRAVKLQHYGEIGFANYGMWGTCQTDPWRSKEEAMA